MTNRFISWLEHVGQAFHKGLDVALPFAETAGKVAVAIFAPELGPIFNSTVAAVVTAEQGFAAVGRQTGTGASKLAAVAGLMGPLIKQGLADAGKQNDDSAVEKYITAVVTILNSLPAPAIALVAATVPAALPAVAEASPVAGNTAPPAIGSHSEGGSAAEVIFPHH